MYFKNFVLFLFLTQCFGLLASVDCIVFSFNRPMQLYAFLESAEKYLTGIESKTVIVRSDNNFQEAYSIVKEAFPDVLFIDQKMPYSDFKNLTIQVLEEAKSSYVFFAVDDDIVTEYADLTICSKVIEETNAYCFLLRLGLNITFNYQSNTKHNLPAIQQLDHGILQWNLNDKNTVIADWRYPHNVDMTIYRCNDVKRDLQDLDFKNPNTLEAGWANMAKNVAHQKALCFSKSIMVNIPINRVQTDWNVPFMHSWTVIQLLTFFESGLKIDINPLFGLQNPSCHFDYQLAFTTR